MTFDTYERVDLTGPWAGFGFQGHRFFTPENYDIEPCGMPGDGAAAVAGAVPGPWLDPGPGGGHRQQ
ncbi:hypothetical protein CDO19_06300 [Xanthomonas oryzae pv. oryzae]|nr:hypothetical protein CDO19_06300 [Xanthomonas oryzae pv. oryzae]